MKVNDKVDVMSDISYNHVLSWTGWTIEFISGDFALIMKTEELDVGGHPPLKRIERKKVALATLRPAHPISHKPGETQRQVGKLPKAGAGVMFKIPGDFNQRWEFGLVVQQNKNSVKVLHDSKLINRNRSQFIELQDESL